MSDGPDHADLYRRAPRYVAKVLNGTDPAELPVKFEFVVNLDTAEVLGITNPPSILLRADEVIE